jgi:hypothetical protein
VPKSTSGRGREDQIPRGNKMSNPPIDEMELLQLDIERSKQNVERLR